jgi:hypothetical protein
MGNRGSRPPPPPPPPTVDQVRGTVDETRTYAFQAQASGQAITGHNAARMHAENQWKLFRDRTALDEADRALQRVVYPVTKSFATPQTFAPLEDALMTVLMDMNGLDAFYGRTGKAPYASHTNDLALLRSTPESHFPFVTQNYTVKQLLCLGLLPTGPVMIGPHPWVKPTWQFVLYDGVPFALRKKGPPQPPPKPKPKPKPTPKPQPKTIPLLPPVRAGLQLHLDVNLPNALANQDRLWRDLSGRNRHVLFNAPVRVGTVVHAASRKRVAYVSTLGRVARGPPSNALGITDTSGYTIFFLARTVAASTNSAFKFFGDRVYGGRGIFVHPTWTNRTLYWDQGGCCGANTRTTAALANPFGRALYALRCNVGASRRQIWINGRLVATNAARPAPLRLNRLPIAIGGGEGAWNGQLSLFLVYNRPLSDREMAAQFAYFRARYPV